MKFREWYDSQIAPTLLEAVRPKVGNNDVVFIKRLTTLLSDRQSKLADYDHAVHTIRHQFTYYDDEWKALEQKKFKIDLCDYLRSWHKIIDETASVVSNLIKRLSSKYQNELLASNIRWAKTKKREKTLPPECEEDDDPMLYRSSLL